MVFIGKILISVFATEMLAITKESADFLFFKKYIKNKKVKIVPNAIQLDIYKNISNEEIIKLKKQYTITSNNVVIGHVGRFEVMKNHKFLIDLFFDYNKLNPNSILVLIGDGTLKMVMEKLVKDLGLNNNVIFLGIRSDVYLWMNIFDLVLLPSLFEGLPGVASEAQAAGTPCVLSNTITNKSDLGLGLLRYLSITGDKGDWIKAINYYIKTNKPSFSLIENKFDEKNLSLSKGIEVLNKIYKIS
jgi:glycosyltransferase EpsF